MIEETMKEYGTINFAIWGCIVIIGTALIALAILKVWGGVG